MFSVFGDSCWGAEVMGFRRFCLRRCFPFTQWQHMGALSLSVPSVSQEVSLAYEGGKGWFVC